MRFALMGLLFVLASAWLTRPLWSRGIGARQRRRAANVAAYRQRLLEIEADVGAGLVDADTAGGLRAELDSRLLLDAEGGEEAPTSPSARSLPLTVGLAVLVLGIAAFGYLRQGTWKLDREIASAPLGAGMDGQSVDKMVATLAQKLEQNPGDPQGWALLGRSYFVMQRYEGAAKAYAKANALTENREPELLVGEGEALGLASGRDLRGRPKELFDAALALDPDNGKALWYAGMAAAQGGDADAAKAHWLELSKQDLPPELRAVLAERLAQLGVASRASVQAAPAAASADPGEALVVSVSIAAELRDRVSPDSTLFVFAKAQEGPPMPLAVFRGNASELPREIRLDDSMAMSPAAKLSQFDRWVVTARVSRAGQAKAVTGDLQGSLTAARADLGKSALALTIDEVVP